MARSTVLVALCAASALLAPCVAFAPSSRPLLAPSRGFVAVPAAATTVRRMMASADDAAKLAEQAAALRAEIAAMEGVDPAAAAAAAAAPAAAPSGEGEAPPLTAEQLEEIEREKRGGISKVRFRRKKKDRGRQERRRRRARTERIARRFRAVEHAERGPARGVARRTARASEATRAGNYPTSHDHGVSSSSRPAAER